MKLAENHSGAVQSSSVPKRRRQTGTHQFDLFCTPPSLHQPFYFELFTSTSVHRHFVKSGILIGREAHVEVQLWSKKSLGRSKFGGSKYRKGRTDAYPVKLKK